MASAASKTANKAVVPKAATQVAKKEQAGTVAVPDYIKQGMNRGSENVGMEDLVIPRLEVIQALSPAIKKSDPAYIEGAEQGMLFNSVTRKLYGHNAVVCPVFFRKEYLVWKDRKAGGGFRGAFPTLEEAQIRINQEDDPEQFTAQETAQQFCLLLDDATGETEEIVVSMSRSKLKVSRAWNALIRMNGNDRFTRIYNVFAVEDSNDKGDDFWNLNVQTLGFAPVEVYKKGEALYESVKRGERNVVADTSTDTPPDDALEPGKDY
jgi:hypothetical protein